LRNVLYLLATTNLFSSSIAQRDFKERSYDDSIPFETIRKTSEDGGEYWSARDLAKVLGCDRWENF
jgi:hypothetical protein